MTISHRTWQEVPTIAIAARKALGDRLDAFLLGNEVRSGVWLVFCQSLAETRIA
jgi:hypothetical protein